jgi:type 1 glutamine amidotransferase
MKKSYLIILLLSALITILPSCNSGKIKVLIVTGQSDNNWKTSSEAVRQILDETGLFSSAILNSPARGEDMSGFSPKFSKYNLVVLDYDGDKWPEKTTSNLVDYVNNGGGLVFFDSKSDPVAGTPAAATISKRHSYEIRTRAADHPITKGLPVRWMHPDDEIIQGLQVPGEGAEILATAFSDTSFSGTGKMEPVLVARNLGKGRIFTTMMGAPDEEESRALHCTGFIVTFQRGAEWAATGNVTQEVPYDFPTASGAYVRPDFKPVTMDDAFGKITEYDITKSTRYFTYIQSAVRKAAGDEKALSDIEKKMDEVLNNPAATDEAKKLILRELSWMGTEYSVPAIKALENVPELKDGVAYALERLSK